VARIEFGGKIGNDWRDSEPWWPPLPTPPAGAPNVVLIVLDDVGFAQLGCYGSDIATPVIDGIAAQGVRLTNFHTTALCSPTRACHRLSRLLGTAAPRERIPLRDSPGAGLRHLRRREVAPDARGRDEYGALA